MKADHHKTPGHPACLFLLIAFSCLLLNPTGLKAQSNEKQEQAAENTEQSARERYFIFGTAWGNNSSFLGRNQEERLPFLSTDFSYISKSGFWLSAVAYQVLNTASTIDEVDLSAGWSFYPSDRIDAALYYSKFFFSPESSLLKASTGNTANGYVGLDWNILYSRITATATFGGSTDVFLILDNSRYFSTGSLLHKSDTVSIEPRFSLIAGTQTFVENHMTRQGISPVYSPGTGRPGGPGAGGKGAGTTEEQSTQTSFNILNYELALPVTYSIGKLSLEITPRYSIPVNQLEGSEIPAQLFVTTSLYYVLSTRK